MERRLSGIPSRNYFRKYEHIFGPEPTFVLCGRPDWPMVRRTACFCWASTSPTTLGDLPWLSNIFNQTNKQDGYRLESRWKTHWPQQPYGSRVKERLREVVGEAFLVSCLLGQLPCFTWTNSLMESSACIERDSDTLHLSTLLQLPCQTC